jgi:hypothetical protein
MNELDALKQKNEDRIKEIEERYFQKKNEIKTSKDILNEMQDNFEIKEKHIDSSISYPTYGRNLKPGLELDTFMIQQNMCGATKKRRPEDGTVDSPVSNVQA